MAVLSSKARKKLPSSSFAIPSRARTPGAKAKSGNYPIGDRQHAANALSRVSQFGTPAEKAQVRSAVKRKYPGMGKAKPKAKAKGR